MTPRLFTNHVKRRTRLFNIRKLTTHAICGGWIKLLIIPLVVLQSVHLVMRMILDERGGLTGGLSSAFAPSWRQQNQDLYNGTIVVQLSGEMGNNLHKLAFAKALQWMADDSWGIHLNLVLRHQDHSKWLSTRGHLQQCFFNLRGLNFKAGNGPEFAERLLEQKLWLGGVEDSKVLEVHGNDESNMTMVLQHLKRILETKSIPPQSPTASTSSVHDIDTIHLPFILADQMVGWHTLDRYRQRFVDWLAFDYQACCPSDLPRPDESVFHFRNFLTELKSATIALGFDELSPKQTAYELLGHLKPGNKVAITTRFDNDVTQQYVKAMTDRALQVRVMGGHSTTQDFCFLTKAQKELIGGQRSSFFAWAAYLGIHTNGDGGGIQKVRSYSVSPPATTASSKHGMRSPYEWKDPLLKERWEFQVYKSEYRIPTKIDW